MEPRDRAFLKFYVYTGKFIKGLHQRMRGDVWRWAGKYRTTERNLGIHYYEILMTMRELLADTKPGGTQDLFSGRDCGPLSSSSGEDSPLPEWQRSALPPDRGPARDEPGRGALHLGKCKSAAGRRRAQAIY